MAIGRARLVVAATTAVGALEGMRAAERLRR